MSEERPYIQIDHEVPRPMTDEEYAEYLEESIQAEADMQQIGKPLEEIVAEQRQEIEELKEALNLLLSGVTEDG